MKTMPTRLAVVASLAISLLCFCLVSNARAEDTKSFKGKVSAVNLPDHNLTVKLLGFSRSFSLGDSTKLNMEHNPDASLKNLRAGQEVEVLYVTENGVSIAREIRQHDLTLSGTIKTMDAAKHTLTIKNLALDRDFTIADSCVVELNGKKAGALDDLKIGQSVIVVYEEPADHMVAYRIEQKSDTFTGTVRAVDTSARTVKARYLLVEKQFHLAKDCKIILPGRPDAALGDLRIGDKATFTYETVDGTYIASRISCEPEPQVSDVK
jgi:Cu/Ag efflux protein CusF